MSALQIACNADGCCPAIASSVPVIGRLNTMCTPLQVWRPLKGPVKEAPLGLIDAQTVDKKTDLMDLRLQFEARAGYNYAVRHNPGVTHAQYPLVTYSAESIASARFHN